MVISNEQIKRYAGQINLKKISISGQEKIMKSKVLIIGLGGLGTPALTYLSRSGIKNIGIADSDKVSISNLHRQILYEKKDLFKYKVNIAKTKILAMDPDIKIKSFKKKITKQNIKSIAGTYDIILDGTDSFQSKLLISDYCKKHNKILIIGAINQFVGQLFVFNFKNKKLNSPCLRCFMPKAPDQENNDCQAQGIIGTIAGVIGTLMANETIKEILSFKDTISGKILIIDLQKTIFRLVNLNKNCQNHR